MRDPVEIEKELNDLKVRAEALKDELVIAKFGASVGDILRATDYDKRELTFFVEEVSDKGVFGTMVVAGARARMDDPFLKWEKAEFYDGPVIPITKVALEH